jgi:hypothetical protein
VPLLVNVTGLPAVMVAEPDIVPATGVAVIVTLITIVAEAIPSDTFTVKASAPLYPVVGV